MTEKQMRTVDKIPLSENQSIVLKILTELKCATAHEIGTKVDSNE
jgi:hypothetical protein